MRELLYITLCVFLLISCGGRKNTRELDTSSSYISDVPDTLTIDSVVEQKENNDVIDAPIKTTTPSRSRYKIKDNMRGFDPPSEDDMDDNGMTRYMEVNDDNGWD